MKALVKHELRNIWGIMLYFIGCFGLGAFQFYGCIQREYHQYLSDSYNYDTNRNLLYNLTEMGESYIVAIGIGLLILLYVQFKDNKSIGVSSFIKSLPYTNGQIYGVKLGCGIAGFTIPFVLGYALVLAIGNGAREWLSIIEKVSPGGSQLALQNDLGSLLTYGLLVYSITLMAYAFGFWIQYVVNPNIGSIVVSTCGILAVPFMIVTGSEYFRILARSVMSNRNFSYIDNYLSQLTELFFIPNYFSPYTSGFEIQVAQNEYYYIRNLVDTKFITIKILVFILLIIIFLLAICQCNKNYKAENQEAFISSRWAKYLLKVGVTLSSMGVGIWAVAAMSNGYGEHTFLIVNIMMIVCGVVGYSIIHKICQVGRR